MFTNYEERGAAFESRWRAGTRGGRGIVTAAAMPSTAAATMPASRDRWQMGVEARALVW